ncbi:MAG: hypothetical protein GY708_29365 [Actinomycetia bacterium]|nr:hypothetical protein [Actinomycetes bacterium]
MTKTFAVAPSGRSAAIAVTAALVILVITSAGVGLAGVPAGHVLAPVWTVAAFEAGRIAWSARISLKIDASSLLIEGPQGTETLSWDELCWFGLTTRGLVIETARNRHVLFDQFSDVAVAAAETLRVLPVANADPFVISHDTIRRSAAALGAAAIVIVSGLVAVASLTSDLSDAERIGGLATSLPVLGLAALGFRSSAVVPYRVELEKSSVKTRSLIARSRTAPLGSVDAVTSPTLFQRLSGAPAGQRLRITIGGNIWSGPMAAPGTFDEIADELNQRS